VERALFAVSGINEESPPHERRSRLDLLRDLFDRGAPFEAEGEMGIWQAKQVLAAAERRVASWTSREPCALRVIDDDECDDELIALMQGEAQVIAFMRGGEPQYVVTRDARRPVLLELRARAERNRLTGNDPGRPRHPGVRDAAEAECLLLGYCPGRTIEDLRRCIRRGRPRSSDQAMRAELSGAVRWLLLVDRSVTAEALAEALRCSVSGVYGLCKAGLPAPGAIAA
jgi:hypothetical protein